MHLITILLMNLVYVIHAQINIAELGQAEQSSTHGSYAADRALLPPASTDWNPKTCSHTGLGQSTAWWKVDFSSYYFINNIIIYYRKAAASFEHRIDGLSVYISNITGRNIPNPPSGRLCYKDKPGLPYPDPFLDIDCYSIGRNVILYNSKPNVLVELCYIIVNGCPLNKWNTNCTSNCSANCKHNHCYPDTGSCVYGCNSGRCLNDACDSDEICVAGCVSGRAGQRCNKYHNLALKGSVTDQSVSDANSVNDGNRTASSCIILSGTNKWLKVDLSFTSIVIAIYIHFGASDTEVNDGVHALYGSNSSNSWTGSIQLHSGVIPRHDITVQNGIFRYVYYVPPQSNSNLWLQICEMEVVGCPAGKYGNNCNQQCPSGCNGPCYPETGVCMFNCTDGWTGEKCEQRCSNGTFGSQCSQTCSANCFTQPCNHITGKCYNGCKIGWKGLHCTTACTQGYYGKNCENTCNGCLMDQCDRFGGICFIKSGCKLGWKFVESDHKCNEPCDDYKFGENCVNTCYCSTTPCNKSTGKCPGGCKKGYIGDSCSEACQQGYFGFNCSNRCEGCILNQCSNVDGMCTNATRCKPGWKFGPKCSTPCDDGNFGENCTGQCNCLMSPCIKSTGHCTGGCHKGYKGLTCSEACEKGEFGYDCKESCNGCVSDLCDSLDGYCNNSTHCKPGWKIEPKCNSTCDSWYYGINCTEICTCLSEPCDKTTGDCKGGCKEGWTGTSCSEENRAPNDGSSPLGGIAGGIVAALAVIVIVVVIIFMRTRRQNGTGRQYRETCIEKIDEKLSNENDYTNEGSSQQKSRNDVYMNVGASASPGDVKLSLSAMKNAEIFTNENDDMDHIYQMSGSSKHKIPVGDLQKVIKEKEEKAGFKKEYEVLPIGLVHAHGEGEKEQNKIKNRYRTTWPYDHSRVILKGDTKHDYINANYIDNYEKEHAYIATQGPKKNTVRDFWHMIWQENVGKIVMVTNLEEERKKKCDQYWPESTIKALIVDCYKLSMRTETQHTIYIYRLIEVTNKKTQEIRKVHHFHFTQWPDHGVPDQIKLAGFYRKVKDLKSDLTGPMVVHCSAGVGRTGTFMAIDALYSNGKKTGYLDVMEYVQIMRKDRMNMIQTVEQYTAVYEVLLELFIVPDTAIHVSKYYSYMEDLRQKKLPRNQSPLKKEYQKLQTLRPSYSEGDFADATSKENEVKNVVKNVLPHRKYRPFLMSYGRKSSNYINAVFVPGYADNTKYFVTHCPLTHTVVDFWTMIHDHECNIIVLLEPWKEDSPMWSMEKLDFENLSVQISECENDSSDKTQIIVDHKTKNDKRKVGVFSATEWMTNKDVLPSTKCMVDLLKRVSQDRETQQCSVAIVCRDGYNKSGIFLTLCLVLEKMKMDDEVDIFQVVRSIQVRRPEFLSSFDQYEYCYQCIKEYFEEDSVYANVG